MMILLLLFLGVKRTLEATQVPFAYEFETNFAKKYYGVVTFFVIMTAQE